jgi:hypothetical protein
MNILTINLVFSTLVFWIAARIYVLPRLDELGPRTVLLPILLLHAFRHLGLMFLAPGATYPGIPADQANAVDWRPDQLRRAALVELGHSGVRYDHRPVPVDHIGRERVASPLAPRPQLIRVRSACGESSRGVTG